MADYLKFDGNGCVIDRQVFSVPPPASDGWVLADPANFYYTPDGELINVADDSEEDGSNAGSEGEHLPTPPPIPNGY